MKFGTVLPPPFGTTAQGGPWPPSRVSATPHGCEQSFSNFYILLLLHLSPMLGKRKSLTSDISRIQFGTIKKKVWMDGRMSGSIDRQIYWERR
jgi:hypothetical protein